MFVLPPPPTAISADDTPGGALGATGEYADRGHAHDVSAEYAVAVGVVESTVKRLLETGGATLLAGAIPDGTFLKRVGAGLVGAVPVDKELFWLSLNGMAATKQTGALPFAPGFALVFNHWGVTGNGIGFGIARGVGATQQQYLDVSGSGVANGNNSIIFRTGLASWAVDSFQQGNPGVRLTRTSGGTNLDTGVLLVVEA